MASLINRVPPGFLSLLGIKALGENPRLLDERVQGQFDLTNFYFAAAREQRQVDTAAVNATGFWGATAAVVENLKVWVAESITCRTVANLGAGTTVRYRAAILDTAVSGRIVAVSDSAVTATANESPIIGFRQPFVLLPGYQIGVWVESITLGVAPTIRVSVDFAELDI